MFRKLFIVPLCLTALCAPAIGGGCNGGGGGGGGFGGGLGGGLGGGFGNRPGGGFPGNVGFPGNGGYPSPYNQGGYNQHQNPAPVVTSPPVPTLATNTLTDALSGAGPFTVSLQHPLTGEYVTVKVFTTKNEAVAFKSAIERKFFVTTDSDYREAATTSEANTIAAQLRGAGHQVRISNAVAKITTGEEPNLSDVLAKSTPQASAVETPAPVAPPAATVAPTTDPNAETSATLLEALKHAQAIQEAMGQGAATKVTPEPMNPKLQPLVGEWTAVARTESGELSTVELHLDNRGWAKFTAPAKDGSKNTVERKLELTGNQELKLIGDDGELLLGKVASLSADQLVLSQANGQVTFVRPR
jgi:hypothetical protein